MKRIKKPVAYPIVEGGSMSIREAKAQFSVLVGRVAEGDEIVITRHGQPRARLVPVNVDGPALRVDRDWLKSMPVLKKGVNAEKLVRGDRDARG